jgi:hypothetical protein
MRMEQFLKIMPRLSGWRVNCAGVIRNGALDPIGAVAVGWYCCETRDAANYMAAAAVLGLGPRQTEAILRAAFGQFRRQDTYLKRLRRRMLQACGLEDKPRRCLFEVRFVGGPVGMKWYTREEPK